MFQATLIYFSLSHRPGFSTNPAPGVGRLGVAFYLRQFLHPSPIPVTSHPVTRIVRRERTRPNVKFFFRIILFFYFLYSYFLQKYAKLRSPRWLYCCLQQLSIFTPYCVHDGHEYVLVLRGVLVYGVSSAVWHTKAAGLRD